MSHMLSIKAVQPNKSGSQEDLQRRHSHRRSRSTDGPEPEEPSYHLFEPPVLILDGEEINSFLKGNYQRKILPPRPSNKTKQPLPNETTTFATNTSPERVIAANSTEKPPVEAKTSTGGNLTAFLRQSVLGINEEDLKTRQSPQAPLGRSSSSPVMKELPAQHAPQYNMMPAQGHSNTNSGRMLSSGTVTTIQNQQSYPLTIQNNAPSQASIQIKQTEGPQRIVLSNSRVHQNIPTTVTTVTQTGRPFDARTTVNTSMHRSSSCGLPQPGPQTTQMVINSPERPVSGITGVQRIESRPQTTVEKLQQKHATAAFHNNYHGNLAVSWANPTATEIRSSFNVNPKEFFNKSYIDKKPEPKDKLQIAKASGMPNITNVPNSHIAFKSDPSLDAEENKHIKHLESEIIAKDNRIKELERENAELKRKIEQLLARIRELEGLNSRSVDQNAEIQRLRVEETRIQGLLLEISRLKETQFESQRVSQNELSRLKFEEQRFKDAQSELSVLRSEKWSKDNLIRNLEQNGMMKDGALVVVPTQKIAGFTLEELIRNLEEKGMMKDGVLVPAPKIAGFTPEELYQGLVRAEAEIRRLNQLPQEAIDKQTKEEEESHKGNMLWENERLRSVIWHLEIKVREAQGGELNKESDSPSKRNEEREKDLKNALEHIASLNSEIQRLRNNQIFPGNNGSQPIVLSPSNYLSDLNTTLHHQNPANVQLHNEIKLQSRTTSEPLPYVNHQTQFGQNKPSTIIQGMPSTTIQERTLMAPESGALVELVPRKDIEHLQDENKILRGVIDSFSAEKVIMQKQIEATNARFDSPRGLSPQFAPITPLRIQGYPVYLENTAEFGNKQSYENQEVMGQPLFNTHSQGLPSYLGRSNEQLGESVDKLEKTIKSEFAKVNLTQQLIMKKLDTNYDKRSTIETKLKQKKSELDLILKSQLSITNRLANIQGLLEKIDGKDLRESTLHMLEEERRELLDMQTERSNLEHVISDLKAKLESSRKSYLSSQNNSMRNSIFADEHHQKDEHFLRDLELNMKREEVPKPQDNEEKAQAQPVAREKKVLNTCMTRSMLDDAETPEEGHQITVDLSREVPEGLKDRRKTRGDIIPVDIEVIRSDSRVPRKSPHQQSPLSAKHKNHVFDVIPQHHEPEELNSHTNHGDNHRNPSVQFDQRPNENNNVSSKPIDARRGQRQENGKAAYMLNVINEEGIEHSQEYGSGVYNYRPGEHQQVTKANEVAEYVIAPVDSNPLQRRKVASIMPEALRNSNEEYSETEYSKGDAPFALNFEEERTSGEVGTGLGARRIQSIMPQKAAKGDKRERDEIAEMKEQLRRLKEENQNLRHQFPNQGTQENDSLWHEMQKSHHSEERDYKAIDYVGDRPSTAMGARFEFVNIHDKEDKRNLTENSTPKAIDKKKTESIYNFHPSSDMFSQLGNYLNRNNENIDGLEEQKNQQQQKNPDSQRERSPYGIAIHQDNREEEEEYGENRSNGCEFKSMNAHTDDKKSNNGSENLNPDSLKKMGGISANGLQTGKNAGTSHSESLAETVEFRREEPRGLGKDSTGIHFKSQETIRQSQELSRMCINEIENIISAGNKNDKLLRAFPARRADSNDGKWPLTKLCRWRNKQCRRRRGHLPHTVKMAMPTQTLLKANPRSCQRASPFMEPSREKRTRMDS